MHATQQRPVRIANCSGAVADPGYHMYNQAKYGLDDVITGDYLAEVNFGNDAEATANGTANGWIQMACDGIEISADLINEKRIKMVIIGGALKAKGLALKVHELIQSKNLDLKVAWVEGDDLMSRIDEILGEDLPVLDRDNSDVKLAKDTSVFLNRKDRNKIVAANAYLGGRAIRRGLEEGADIIICGRFADASPVIGAAAWWHQWSANNVDALAGILVAGHLIECLSYITELLNLGFGIVEVEANGDCTVTKHEPLNGFVTADTVKCQFLYELQGNIYLNSDVKADITHIRIGDVGKNRVRVSGTKGYPPPSTTKLAIFYKGGSQCELLVNATGYATAKKFALQEAQLKAKLKEWGLLEMFDVLDFQWLRIFAQAQEKDVVAKVFLAFATNPMQHCVGFHSFLDLRTTFPKTFLAFYPGVLEQSRLKEAVNIINNDGNGILAFDIGPPLKTEPLQSREDYETSNPVNLASFGETTMATIGDIALGRSGDKGANINIGLFVHTSDEWDWLCSFLTKAKLRQMMGSD